MNVSKNSQLTVKSTRRRTARIAGTALAAACIGTLMIPAVRAPLARKLGVGLADAPRCEPARGMRAGYQLHMQTELQVNATALLMGRHATGETSKQNVGLSARLRVSDGRMTGLPSSPARPA